MTTMHVYNRSKLMSLMIPNFSEGCTPALTKDLKNKIKNLDTPPRGEFRGWVHAVRAPTYFCRKF